MRDYVHYQAELSGTLPGTGILAVLWRNWVARRAVTKLESLDDHLLRDIGVTRDDLKRAKASPIMQNAMLHLQELAGQRRKPRTRM